MRLESELVENIGEELLLLVEEGEFQRVLVEVSFQIDAAYLCFIDALVPALEELLVEESFDLLLDQGGDDVSVLVLLEEEDVDELEVLGESVGSDLRLLQVQVDETIEDFVLYLALDQFVVRLYEADRDHVEQSFEVLRLFSVLELLQIKGNLDLVQNDRKNSLHLSFIVQQGQVVVDEGLFLVVFVAQDFK